MLKFFRNWWQKRKQKQKQELNHALIELTEELRLQIRLGYSPEEVFEKIRIELEFKDCVDNKERERIKKEIKNAIQELVFAVHKDVERKERENENRRLFKSSQ